MIFFKANFRKFQLTVKSKVNHTLSQRKSFEILHIIKITPLRDAVVKGTAEDTVHKPLTCSKSRNMASFQYVSCYMGF